MRSKKTCQRQLDGSSEPGEGPSAIVLTVLVIFVVGVAGVWTPARCEVGQGQNRLQGSAREIARVTVGTVEVTFSAQPYPLMKETEVELQIALSNVATRKPVQGTRVVLMVTKQGDPSFVNGPYVLSMTERAGQYMVRHIFVTKGRYELAFTLESANGDGANGHLGFAFTEDVRGKKGFLRKLFGTNDKVHGGFLGKLIMVSIVLVTAVTSLK